MERTAPGLAPSGFRRLAGWPIRRIRYARGHQILHAGQILHVNWLPRLGGAVCGAYLAGRLDFGVVAVTPVTHAAGSALKVENNVVDPGFMVDLGVYWPPDPPHSPDQPR